MWFQLNILIITFIVALLLVYIMRSSIVSRKRNKKWPTYVSNCPDYWVDSTGNGSACVSGVYNISSTCSGTKNFKGTTYCDKLSKLSEYNCKNVSWDGVTYAAGNLFEKNKCKTDIKHSTSIIT